MVSASESRRNERLRDALASAGRLDDALGQSAGPRGVLRPRSRGVVEAAATEILQVLDGLNDEDLISLDRRVRSWSEYVHWGHGRNLPRGFVASNAATVRASAAAASFTVNGFTREQACRALGGFMPWSLRLLVIRTSDWVPEVRRAAMSALAGVTAHDVARHVALVEQLARDRTRSDDLAQLVGAVLNNEQGLAELAALRHAPSAVARRTAWRLLMEWSPVATHAELPEAAHDPDPWLRHWAIGRVRHEHGAVALEVARALSCDPVGRLRARGLALEVELGAADRSALTAALSDPSGSVRAVAQYRLQSDEVDVAELYRVRLAERPDVGDILGISEVGQAADAELVRGRLTELRAGYRRAALIALCRLAGDDCVATAAELIDDPSPRVASAALRLLGARRLPAPLVARFEIEAATGVPRVRRRAVVLLRPYPWRWLLATLRCLDEPDDDAAAFVREELSEWRRRSVGIATAPPDGAAREIRDRLSNIDATSAAAIAFVLRTAAPASS